MHNYVIPFGIPKWTRGNEAIGLLRASHQCLIVAVATAYFGVEQSNS
jgi:hypothetical protein